MAGEVSSRVLVDVWSDVMCPFCYLGGAILKRALEQFEHRDRVEVRYHSFLLMPELPVDEKVDLIGLLVEKRGISREQAAQMNAQIAERGREIGLDYRLDRAIATNMRRAHELSHFADAQGHQHPMITRLFKAYFTDGLNLGDREVLADLAAEVGLDRTAALEALDSGEYADAVDADLAEARGIGISGVPFFVFNRKFAVSGAQPEAVFLQALSQSLGDAV